jgi:hypothetical protein
MADTPLLAVSVECSATYAPTSCRPPTATCLHERLAGDGATAHAHPGMQTHSSRLASTRWVGWGTVGAVLAGAALGSASGPVTACEFSNAFGWDLSACAPAGASAGALTGALIGLAATPLGRHGRRRRQPAARRPAPTTSAAAGLVVMAAVAAIAVWRAEWVASEGERGLEALVLMVVGLGIAAGSVALLVLASGLLRRRGWARWAAVVGFSLASVAALSGLLAAASGPRRIPGQERASVPLTELVPPAVLLLVSGAVVVLLLLPPTGRDFRTSGQPSLHDDDRHQGAGGP